MSVVAAQATNGGILSIENGVITGALGAIFGLVAAALSGLGAARAVSARRLSGVELPPDSSVILAWVDAEIAQQTIADLSSPGARSIARGLGIR